MGDNSRNKLNEAERKQIIDALKQLKGLQTLLTDLLKK
jgi:hypothetical protein